MLLIGGFACWLAFYLENGETLPDSQKEEILKEIGADAKAEQEKIYNSYLENPEYDKTGAFVIEKNVEISTLVKNIPFRGSLSHCYDFWKNEKYLCCVTNISKLKTGINLHLHALKSEYKLTEKSKEGKIRQLEKAARFSINNEVYRVHTFCVPLEDIQYFSIRGDKYATTEISGGGGTVGGSAITGAIVGGAIAGGTGAVIGSRKESTIDPIKSNTVVINEKETYIKIKSMDGTISEITASGHSGIKNNPEKFYEVLKQLIPEKEYAYMEAQRNLNSQSSGKENSIEERLTKAKELFDNGLITQEEYEKKRESILEDM